MIFGIVSLAMAVPLAAFRGAMGQAGGVVAMVWTLIVLIGAVYLFYKRVFQYLPRVRRVTLFSLRALGLLSLTLLLFEPVLGFVHNPENKPRLAIVVDASGSMSYSDAANQPNRYRQAAIAVQNTLVPRLEKAFDLQVFAYDGKHSGAWVRRTIWTRSRRMGRRRTWVRRLGWGRRRTASR